MDKYILPARVPLANIFLKFKQPNPPYGYDLKMRIRSKAKRNPIYRTKIQVEPLVQGQNDSGEKIEINTLGKWLFGVPGYRGHIMVVPSENEINISICAPQNKEIQNLIIELIMYCTKKMNLTLLKSMTF